VDCHYGLRMISKRSRMVANEVAALAGLTLPSFVDTPSVTGRRCIYGASRYICVSHRKGGRVPLTPLQYWLFTPELQWQPRGQTAYLTWVGQCHQKHGAALPPVPHIDFLPCFWAYLTGGWCADRPHASCLGAGGRGGRTGPPASWIAFDFENSVSVSAEKAELFVHK
jgi:hypothetical protein